MECIAYIIATIFGIAIGIYLAMKKIEKDIKRR